MTVPQAAQTVQAWQNGIRALWAAHGGDPGYRPLTLEQLLAIMPELRAHPELAAKYLPLLNQAMAEAGIDTPRRQAAFLAQLGAETGGLSTLTELGTHDNYSGGNRYKGRGPIQLTGRPNYQAASQALGIDLVGHPELAADPAVGFRVAGWYWATHAQHGPLSNNGNADVGSLAAFQNITRNVNGGLNGESTRETYWNRARRVLQA